MNGGERYPDRSSERIRGKGITWKNCRNKENSIDILILRRTAYFSIHNLYLIPTLKKILNIILSVNFLENLR